MPISSALFGESPYESYGKQKSIDTPLSLSASTTGSVARRTAWRSSDSSGPTPYSSKTRGSTLNWDDAQAQTLPTSDKGASFGGK
jgi:hypothetical protein